MMRIKPIKIIIMYTKKIIETRKYIILYRQNNTYIIG